MTSHPARPDWETWLTPEGRFPQVPSSFERITGRTVPPDVKAADVLRLVVHPDDLPAVLAHLEAELADDRRAGETEFRVVRPDGGLRWVHHCCEPVYDEAGRYAGTRSSVHDVTDLKRAQEALSRERSLLSSVMQATDVMLVYLDPAFNFVWVNAAYAATCHYPPEEMVGKNHFALYPHPENEAIFRRVCRTGESVFFKDRPFEFPDQPERGVTHWDWSLVPVKGAGGETEGLVFSLRETTRYVRAEAALRESEDRFRLFMDNSPTIAWMKDESGRHVYLSQTCQDRFGVQFADWQGKTDAELWPAETASEFRRNDLVVLDTGQPIQVIEQTIGADGSRSHWLNSKFPIRDADGRRFVGGIGLDITALTRAQEELAAAKAAAEEARREAEAANQAKDHFIAMVSHELRTPLTPSILAMSLLLAEPRLPADLRARVELVARNLELEARLIDDLLDVGRITSGKLLLKKAPTDVASAINEAARVVSGELEAKGQTLVIEAPDAPYLAVADSGRLAQVFWNLLRNSIKFSPAGSRIVIRARTETTGSPPVRELLVEVVDEGCGIDPRRLPRIFEPFEQELRTAGHGGLGLGLNICRAVVGMHGGTISAHSDGPGRGATFSVRLPLSDAMEAATDLREEAGTTGETVEAAVAHPLRVLLVEDDPDSGTLMRLLLEQKGYEVTVARGFASALAALNASRPDVLVSDLGLPDGNGLDLPGEFRSRGLATPAIALSGYGMEADIERSRAAGFAAHLVKPLKDVEQLIEAIEGLGLAARAR